MSRFQTQAEGISEIANWFKPWNGQIEGNETHISFAYTFISSPISIRILNEPGMEFCLLIFLGDSSNLDEMKDVFLLLSNRNFLSCQNNREQPRKKNWNKKSVRAQWIRPEIIRVLYAMLVHHGIPPPRRSIFPCPFIHLGVKRGTVIVKCLPKNTSSAPAIAWTQSCESGVKCTNN